AAPRAGARLAEPSSVDSAGPAAGAGARPRPRPRPRSAARAGRQGRPHGVRQLAPQMDTRSELAYTAPSGYCPMSTEPTRKHGIACLVSVLGLAVGCATPAGRAAETDLARALVTTDQENQIGLQVKGELEQKQHVQYVSDPAIVEYVRGVAGRVIAVGRR